MAFSQLGVTIAHISQQGQHASVDIAISVPRFEWQRLITLFENPLCTWTIADLKKFYCDLGAVEREVRRRLPDIASCSIHASFNPTGV